MVSILKRFFGKKRKSDSIQNEKPIIQSVNNSLDKEKMKWIEDNVDNLATLAWEQFLEKGRGAVIVFVKEVRAGEAWNSSAQFAYFDQGVINQRWSNKNDFANVASYDPNVECIVGFIEAKRLTVLTLQPTQSLTKIYEQNKDVYQERLTGGK